MPQPTILINAYNRPAALSRLLDSLLKADVPAGTDLLISIDGGGDPEVIALAETASWPFGDKSVLVQPQHLGLIAHFLQCGALTRDLGDMVYLEDDLVVSRKFFDFSRQALDAYRDDHRIAGISLNRLPVNGYTNQRFVPLPDYGDVFFTQVYWYQGQAYTRQMWELFEDWWHAEMRPIRPDDGLHPLFLPHARWRDDFFPQSMRYLHTTGRYFIFPRTSHTTLFGDPGTHFKNRTDVFQVPLQHHQSRFRFSGLDEARAVYDSFLEISPDTLAPYLPAEPVNVDLNGTKPPAALNAPHTLTIRPVRKPAATFGLRMRPPELNVIDMVPGQKIKFGATGAVGLGWWSDLLTTARLDGYYHQNRPGLLRHFLYRLLRRYS